MLHRMAMLLLLVFFVIVVIVAVDVVCLITWCFALLRAGLYIEALRI